MMMKRRTYQGSIWPDPSSSLLVLRPMAHKDTAQSCTNGVPKTSTEDLGLGSLDYDYDYNPDYYPMPFDICDPSFCGGVTPRDEIIKEMRIMKEAYSICDPEVLGSVVRASPFRMDAQGLHRGPCRPACQCHIITVS
ncbi:unnamed protein product [Arctogadus glacialis]